MWDAEAEAFDGPADHGLRDPEVRSVWQTLLGELLPAGSARIADLGCGTGTLSLLMADMGHRVDGLDFSTQMLDRARAKAAGRAEISFTLGDAAAPPFPAGAYDVVLSRHVLWALSDPAAGLAGWCELLIPGGRLVLIEGLWSNGAGMTAAEVTGLVTGLGRPSEVRELSDPGLWGQAISDQRYAIVSAAAGANPAQ
jgi:SAM-dependent methyltransferase